MTAIIECLAALHKMDGYYNSIFDSKIDPLHHASWNSKYKQKFNIMLHAMLWCVNVTSYVVGTLSFKVGQIYCTDKYNYCSIILEHDIPSSLIEHRLNYLQILTLYKVCEVYLAIIMPMYQCRAYLCSLSNMYIFTITVI